MVDFLLRDEARCAVNAPALSADAFTRLRPYLQLARRLGLFLTQTLDHPIQKVEITYTGELAQQSAPGLRVAALAGLLQPTLDGPVNTVNAELLADERGIRVFEQRGKPDEPTTICISGATKTGERRHEIIGTVFRDRPRIIRFNGFGMELEPEGSLLLTHHRDAPGVLGAVATWLGDRAINISGLSMGEAGEAHETALALFKISRSLNPKELRELAEHAPIRSARSIVL